MANPFYQNNMSANMAPFRDAYKMFANSKNPMELFIKMAEKNPNLQPAIAMIQAGQNPQAVFTQLCQQRGINPQEFLKSITG